MSLIEQEVKKKYFKGIEIQTMGANQKSSQCCSGCNIF